MNGKIYKCLVSTYSNISNFQQVGEKLNLFNLAGSGGNIIHNRHIMLDETISNKKVNSAINDT